MNTPTRSRGALGVACALLATLFLVAQPVPSEADVVRLKTGAAIKGEPLRGGEGGSDQEALVMIDFLTGARRRLLWEVVSPTDRDRLWTAWGWRDSSRRVVTGHRVRQQLLNGQIEDVLGLVEDGGDLKGPVVRVRSNGRVMDITTAQVKEVIEEEMDPRDIWSPEQLYERARTKLAEAGADLGNLTSEHHWILAENARWADYLEKALEHYEACANYPDFIRAPIARERLAEVASLLRDQAALRALRDIRMAIGLKSFTRARGMLEAFEAEYPEMSDAVKRRFEEAKAYFDEKRQSYFRNEARTWFVKITKKQISKKVREKDIELAEVIAWTKRELPELAWAELSARFQRKDDRVTPADAEAFWNERKKASGWKSASFGGGTFVQFKPKIKPPKRKRGGKKKSSGGAAPKVTIPKPPTRDQWWARASMSERESWVLAKFVLDSGFFEINDRNKLSPCPTCNGSGLQSKTNSNGTQLAYLCTRCAGAQNDVRIRFR